MQLLHLKQFGGFAFLLDRPENLRHMNHAPRQGDIDPVQKVSLGFEIDSYVSLMLCY